MHEFFIGVAARKSGRVGEIENTPGRRCAGNCEKLLEFLAAVVLFAIRSYV